VSQTLTVGDSVIDFVLNGVDGAEYRSAEARKNGLFLFVIWKKGCGTCRYTFPYLQRFHDAYAGETFAVWGLSQDTAEETRDFVREYGANFPQLIDSNLTVTETYYLTTVPSIYLVDRSDTILRHAPAFIADELNAMSQLISERTGKPYVPIVRPEDNAPALKPG